VNGEHPVKQVQYT